MSINKYIMLLLLVLPSLTFCQSIVEIQSGATIGVELNADICSDQYVINGTFNVSGTTCNLLAAPLLVSPAEGSTVNQPVTCVWNKRTSAINYRYQLSSDSLFGTIVLNDSTLTDSVKTVSGLSANTNYWWRVRAKNGTGWGLWSTKRKFKTATTGIGQISSEVPKEFKLYDNYPNPFNPTTNIKFDVAKLSDVMIILFDIMGREVQTLVNKKLQPGTYETSFDGSQLTSGAYFYKLTTSKFTDVKRMILLK